MSTVAIVPPAKGLKRLTWAQIEQLDAIIDSTGGQEEEFLFQLLVRNGKPVKIGTLVPLSKFSPIRL